MEIVLQKHYYNHVSEKTIFINDCIDEIFFRTIIIFMKACNNKNKYALLSHFVAFYVFLTSVFDELLRHQLLMVWICYFSTRG